MTSLAAILPKLSNLVPRPASGVDGEVVVIVRAFDEALRGIGCDWHGLSKALTPARPQSKSGARPEPQRPPTWLEVANWRALCANAGTLSATDAEFVLSMVRLLRLYGEPTEKQGKWLRTIYEKLERVQ